MYICVPGDQCIWCVKVGMKNDENSYHFLGKHFLWQKWTTFKLQRYRKVHKEFSSNKRNLEKKTFVCHLWFCLQEMLNSLRKFLILLRDVMKRRLGNSWSYKYSFIILKKWKPSSFNPQITESTTIKRSKKIYSIYSIDSIFTWIFREMLIQLLQLRLNLILCWNAQKKIFFFCTNNEIDFHHYGFSIKNLWLNIITTHNINIECNNITIMCILYTYNQVGSRSIYRGAVASKKLINFLIVCSVVLPDAKYDPLQLTLL